MKSRRWSLPRHTRQKNFTLPRQSPGDRVKNIHFDGAPPFSSSESHCKRTDRSSFVIVPISPIYYEEEIRISTKLCSFVREEGKRKKKKKLLEYCSDILYNTALKVIRNPRGEASNRAG